MDRYFQCAGGVPRGHHSPVHMSSMGRCRPPQSDRGCAESSLRQEEVAALDRVDPRLPQVFGPDKDIEQAVAVMGSCQVPRLSELSGSVDDAHLAAHALTHTVPSSGDGIAAAKHCRVDRLEEHHAHTIVAMIMKDVTTTLSTVPGLHHNDRPSDLRIAVSRPFSSRYTDRTSLISTAGCPSSRGSRVCRLVRITAGNCPLDTATSSAWRMASLPTRPTVALIQARTRANRARSAGCEGLGRTRPLRPYVWPAPRFLAHPPVPSAQWAPSPRPPTHRPLHQSPCFSVRCRHRLSSVGATCVTKLPLDVQERVLDLVL